MAGDTRGFLTHGVAREVLARAAAVLAPADIPLMPLKGIWLQARVYDPPEARPLTDVDVLVPEARFEQALSLLERDGFVREQDNRSECALTHADLPLQLDVHCRLFQPGAFALPTAALFARARIGSAIFGVELHEPDPVDVLAHLVGHFVKSRAAPAGSPYHEDFQRMFDVLNLDPVTCALRLQQSGMSRAAGYAFAHNAREGHEGPEAVLAALPIDPIGAALCGLSALVAARAGPHQLMGAVPGYLLDRSLMAGVLGAGRRASERLRIRA